MSKAKAKYVKQKKPSTFWPKLRKGLRALVSNQAVIELRETKWYAPVIVGLLSVIVAVVPTLVNGLKQKGSDILATPTASTEIGLIHFAEKLEEKDIDIVIDPEAGSIELDRAKWDQEFTATIGPVKTYHVFADVYERQELIMDTEESEANSSIVNVDTTPSLHDVKYCYVSVFDLTDLNSEEMKDEIIGTNDVTRNGTTAILGLVDVIGKHPYASTSLFLGKESFVLVKSPKGTAVSSSRGYREFKYSSLKQGVNLRDLAKQDPHGEAYSVTKAENVDSYLEQATASWKLLLDDAWNTTRVNSSFATTGMWLGIYAGAVAFLGLMIFLFTRGKMNPLNVFTFWQCETIVGWAAITPAILSMIGFAIKSYASIIFLVLFGVRILWMVFRSLRPVQQ